MHTLEDKNASECHHSRSFPSGWTNQLSFSIFPHFCPLGPNQLGCNALGIEAVLQWVPTSFPLSPLQRYRDDLHVTCWWMVVAFRCMKSMHWDGETHVKTIWESPQHEWFAKVCRWSLERFAGGGQGGGCRWVWGNEANTVAGRALEVVGTADRKTRTYMRRYWPTNIWICTQSMYTSPAD